MAITDLLATTRSKGELKIALEVLREFKDGETEGEWLACPFAAWAKLEQMQEFLEHLVEGKPLQSDTIAYMRKHPVTQANAGAN